ncbi:TIL domain-containing cysteine-rich salivary secreted peptide [Anopheles sinensis]|uniref:TIL domain-containing cysteine-rich salivary secreted peptide n=1 Tax=Anopheles sinensis TaxID=74873 RepID=A0A084WUY0_ANOSI|nr:TIL domain-containing cysteine-rich salivary secreted peptide [Anopheles sinensis]KFB54024.1 TIL domain-containing cysteine-rich salivary secreted peptide [Anopheles sinensis]
MFKLTVLTIAVCVLLVKADHGQKPGTPAPKCRKGERFLDCGNSCMEPKCTKPPVNFPCITLCLSGCYCREGYVRNDKGVCVPPSKCPGVKNASSSSESNES